MKSLHFIIPLLLISVGFNSYLVLRLSQPPQRDSDQRYIELRTNYISLAKAHINLMEVMFKNLHLKNEIGNVFDGDYSGVSEEKFEEAVRRKIVRLEMEVGEMQD
jgi:hypothetical protein